MTIPELMLAYRQAEDAYYVTDLQNSAECIEDCAKCPASKACNFLANITTANCFEDAFKLYFTPAVLNDSSYASVDTIKQLYPEYFI